MANTLGNRVKMSVSGTPGTGTITLGSAVTGFQSFASAGIANGNTVPYVIEDSTVSPFPAWEIGVGTYTSSGTTLARTSITASSNSGSAISATSSAIVMISPLAADLQSTDTLTSGTLGVARGGTGLSSGTSGGVPYYSASGTIASSAALAANSLVIGGGAGAAPSTTTTASGILTFLGTPSSANLAAAVTDETGSGALVFGTAPTFTTSITDPLVIGGTGTTSTLTLRSTSGVGTTGADIVFQTGNNGATEVMRIVNGGNVGVGASPLASTKFYVSRADGDFHLGLAGTTKGIRFATASTATTLDATDNTLAASYQQLNMTATVIQFGCGVRPDTDNSYTCGTSALRWSTVYSQGGVVTTSDINVKTDIINSPLGLNFISALRPVAYKFKVGENIVERDIGNSFNTIVTPRSGVRQHFGLIAQEVKEALPSDIDFGGWVLLDKNDPNSEQALRYEQFIAPMIKAIQELSEKNAALEARVSALEAK